MSTAICGHGTRSGSSKQRMREALARVVERETYTCCGEDLVGLLAAENHLVFAHSLPRIEAREGVARLAGS